MRLGQYFAPAAVVYVVFPLTFRVIKWATNHFS